MASGARLWPTQRAEASPPSNQQAFDSAGKPRLMTDGAGLISLDLASQIPPVLNGLVREGPAGRCQGSGREVCPIYPVEKRPGWARR